MGQKGLTRKKEVAVSMQIAWLIDINSRAHKILPGDDGSRNILVQVRQCQRPLEVKEFKTEGCFSSIRSTSAAFTATTVKPVEGLTVCGVFRTETGQGVIFIPEDL